MELAFYEEHPTAENLKRLEMFDAPVDLIIAAKNLAEYGALAYSIKKCYRQVRRIGYWPILDLKEGYWMSYFSDASAIERVVSELDSRERDNRLWLVWDCEDPLMIRPSLFASQAPNYHKTKKRVESLMRNSDRHNLEIETAEYPFVLIPKLLERVSGTTFSPHKFDTTQNKMLYMSLFRQFARKLLPESLALKLSKNRLKTEITRGMQRYGDKFAVSLGLLAKAEDSKCNFIPSTSEEFLDDLRTTVRAGVKKIRIYRLGGLAPELSGILEGYAKR